MIVQNHKKKNEDAKRLLQFNLQICFFYMK
jgi:hypothetical protein